MVRPAIAAWLSGLLLCVLVDSAAAARPAAVRPVPQAQVTMTVDTDHPYVQAQVLVTLRLARDIGPYPAVWFVVPTVPSLDQGNAIVRPLKSRTTRRVVQRGGSRSLITEWRYALFPQDAGAMSINPLGIQVRVASAGGLVRLESIHTRRVHLHVRPVPKQFTGAVWLPAKSVYVFQDFYPRPSSLTIGTPISRRLALTFDGAQSGELPAFHGRASAGLDVQDFQPQRSEQSTASGLAATLEQRVFLTPTRTGQVEIPSLEVPWWNTVIDKEEVARFPGYTLTVAPAAAHWGTHRPRHAQSATFVASGVAGRPQEDWLPWRWLGLAVLTCLAGLSGWWLWGSRRVDLSPCFGFWMRWRLKRSVMKACARHDASGAACAIRRWAQAAEPSKPPCTLRQLARRVAEPLRGELLGLNATLYGGSQPTWSGEALARAMRYAAELRAPKRRGALRRLGLASLHPLVDGDLDRPQARPL